MKNLRCLKKLFCIVLLVTVTLPLQAISIENIGAEFHQLGSDQINCLNLQINFG